MTHIADPDAGRCLNATQPIMINTNLNTPFELSEKNQLSSQRMQAKLSDLPFNKTGS